MAGHVVEAYGGDRPLLACIAGDESGEAVAIVSMYLVSQRPLRFVKFVGHGPGGVLGPIYVTASDANSGASREFARLGPSRRTTNSPPGKSWPE